MTRRVISGVRSPGVRPVPPVVNTTSYDAATAAVKLDGALQDLRLPLRDGAQLEIVRVGDQEALPVLRHSTAHVLAEAVQAVFPGTKVTIGPAIADGFYYDFSSPSRPSRPTSRGSRTRCAASSSGARIRSSAA